MHAEDRLSGKFIAVEDAGADVALPIRTLLRDGSQHCGFLTDRELNANESFLSHASYFFFTNRNFAHRFRCAAAIRLRPSADILRGPLRPPVWFPRDSNTRMASASRSTVALASLCCDLRIATTSSFGIWPDSTPGVALSWERQL